MNKAILFAATAAAMTATPAAAADFTGFRAGIQLGLDRGAYDNNDADIDESFGGVLAGFSAGYDFPVGGNVILGVEATAEEANTDYDFRQGADFIAVDAKRDLGLVARAGLKVSDRALVYALAGYSNVRLRASARIAGVSYGDSGNVDGLRLGAGLETALGRKGYGKVEYRYSDYSDGFSRNQILIGAGLRF